MYLGGAAHFYAQSFQKFLTELETDSVYPTTIVYPTDTSPLTAARELFSLNTNLPRYSLLPALQCTNKKESNDASLVVMVEQGTEIGILTGDATKKTTDHIMAYHPRFTAKLLQASHHGAADEGCNDQAWIQWLNPSCIIMSSGLNFSHPRESVVKSLLSLLPAEAAGTPFHSVAFGEEDRSLQSATSYKRGYHLVSTNKKLFGTLRHGTITVTLAPALLAITHAGGIPGDAATKNISSLEGSLSRSPEVFSLHNVREINLSGLGVSDHQADEKDTLITLLKTLKATHSTHLYALILADTTISQQDTADALTSLIQSNKNITRTAVMQAPLPIGTEQAIIHAWNNRGLEFLSAMQ